MKERRSSDLADQIIREMEFSTRTRANSTIRGKRKVFFTCHPDDFEKCFDIVCEDILRQQDCTILYIPVSDSDSITATEEKDTNVDLSVFSEINLFVIPVTFKLLRFPNRAMDVDFVYAMEHHVPVLPIMMENGLDNLYALKFDKLEYLDRLEADKTSIGYETKLSKFLNAVLLSDELSKRIRAAFDVYVFLSYRKKDRKYANELMRLIHRNPLCRDIAIWYDEYLIPGEDFEDTIKEALNKCNLFTMVITPNILEPGNYVLENEYPEAYKSGKLIFPVEMLETDVSKLKESFQGIPDMAKDSENDAFHERLLNLLASNGKREQKDNPEHNFLIGLAYLDGIDVEKNYQRGFALINASAESGLFEAAQKLSEIYLNGIGQEKDYAKAAEWAEKAAVLAERLYGPDDEKTLRAKDELVDCYSYTYQFQEAIELQTALHEKRKKLYGEDHVSTILALRMLGYLKKDTGDLQESLRIVSEVSEKLTKALGKDHSETLDTLFELGSLYNYFCKFDKMYELYCDTYEIQRNLYGEYHLATLIARRQIGFSLLGLGEYEKSIHTFQELLEIDQKYLEPENQEIFIVMSSLAQAYALNSKFDMAMKMYQAAYDGLAKNYGPDHPETLTVLQSIGDCLMSMGKSAEAIDCLTKAYEMLKRLFGDKHPSTLDCYSCLAIAHGEYGDYETSLRISKSLYEDFKTIFGEENLDSINELNNIAVCHHKLNQFKESLTSSQKAYEISKDVLGEDDRLTWVIANTIPASLYELGKWEEAVEWGIKVSEGAKRAYGEDHLMTHMFHLNLGRYYCGIGECDKSIEILENEFAIIGEMLGPENERVLSRKIYLVTAYAAKGDVQKALEIGNELLTADLKTFGEDHPETLKLKKELARISSIVS